MQDRKPNPGIQRAETLHHPSRARFEGRLKSGAVIDPLHAIAISPPTPLTYLYQSHHPDLLRFARLRIANPADAEDLVQDAFISASRAYADKPVDELRPLVFTILRNLTLDYLKSGHERRRKMSTDISEMTDRVACEHTVTPEQQVLDAQLLAIARTAIAGLAPRKRQALELHRLEGLTHAEIAKRLCVSPRTVRSDIADALAAIAKALSQAGAPRPDKAE